ncbi:hypothetical protein A5636_18565 [Mycobacterium asiaticum]|uniref:Uncharacterized protein n=2 Tax=Mycobacterium asiaticum TaxID=1790 RepID=A0A1A3NEP4_MYCAS|nr:hypothetical protein A5636_18565 [Mycobacterium asiaticum]
MPPIYPGTTVPPLPPSSSTPVAGAPATFPGDGTFKVGVDIAPGTYRSEGAHDCYWERLRGLSGTLSDTIANGAGSWPQLVQIMPSDLAFKTQHCPTWVPAADAPTSTTSTSKKPVTLPPGALVCPATAAPAGGLTSSAVGSSDTTCQFAEAVRLAYAANGPVSSETRQVDAMSPVTRRHYAMTCSGDGALVVCHGGDGAVVYLY